MSEGAAMVDVFHERADIDKDMSDPLIPVTAADDSIPQDHTEPDSVLEDVNDFTLALQNDNNPSNLNVAPQDETDHAPTPGSPVSTQIVTEDQSDGVEATEHAIITPHTEQLSYEETTDVDLFLRAGGSPSHESFESATETESQDTIVNSSTTEPPSSDISEPSIELDAQEVAVEPAVIDLVSKENDQNDLQDDNTVVSASDEVDKASFTTEPRECSIVSHEDSETLAVHSVEEGDTPSSTTPVSKPIEIIDLTLDDDDDDQGQEEPGNPDSNPSRSEAPISRVKVESEDEICISTEVTNWADPDSANSFHDLPEIGTTAVPDQGEPGMEGQIVDLAISPEQMAQLLKSYNQNSKRSQSPAPSCSDYDTDEEDVKAKVVFRRLKNEYEQRKRLYATSLEEDIDFERHKNQEEARVNARESRKNHDEGHSPQLAEELDDDYNLLFFPEREDSPSADYDIVSGSGYAPDARTPTPIDETEVEKPSKPTRGRPKKGTSNAAGKKTAGNTRVAKRTNTTAPKKRGKKADKAVMFNTDTLGYDIIAEANANQAKNAPPTFASKTKAKAFKELVASIPLTERNLHVGDRKELESAAKEFKGRGAVKSDGDSGWKLRGMKSSLHNYQLLGVSWMRKREKSKTHPYGGILSDDMGFGKTVSALANMVDGVPPEKSPGARATLIVVPSSLMTQWMSEIDKHVSVFKKVLIYRTKMKILNPESYLGDHDVVITAYHDIARSFPRNDPPPDICSADAKEKWWAEQVKENVGPLHKIKWHRIVLDEAQAIKNHLSKTSEAICHLKGKFRWCLSGTPIQNALEEFYPFFRFLRYPHTGNFELFKRNYAKRGSQSAILRLQVILNEIMLRRTHMDQLFGCPILKLPPIKPVETIVVKFNAIERAIYFIVRQRFIMNVNALSRGGADKAYSQIMVLLLRLRQLVGHPLLVQKTIKELLTTEDLNSLWRITEGKPHPATVGSDVAPDGNEETIRALKAACNASQDPGAPFNQSSSSHTDSDNSHMTKVFGKYLQALREDGNWTKANERSLCAACGSSPVNPYLTSCLHLYCYVCLNDLHFTEHMQKKAYANCMDCGQVIAQSTAYAASAFSESGNRKNVPAIRVSTPDEDIDWYTLGGPILRSAKIKGAVEKIKEWFIQDPTNKIIIFTQFRGLIKVLERVCREEDNWGYATYHGAMNFDYRDQQVEKFQTDDDCRILIAGLKAGGVGLNLTAGNRVIILDLWWNVSVESQAFTRCFRIGQKRDVEVVRFVVHDSIDTEIQAMQVRKSKEIEKAMGEGRAPSKLTTNDLMRLFSDISTQAPTNAFTGDEPFIFPTGNDIHDSDDEDVIITGSN